MADATVKLEQVTTAEAAFIVGMPVTRVQKEIDAGPVKPRKVGRRRMLDEADLVYLQIVKELAGKLTPEARAAVYDDVKRKHGAGGRAAGGTIYGQDLRKHYTALRAALGRLHRVRELIDEKHEKGPVIRGTSKEAYRIAALLDGGATIEMVLEDYPSLNRAQVEAARDYAAGHPHRGRPFPSKSIKRAFDEAGLDELADILDEMVAKRRRASR